MKQFNWPKPQPLKLKLKDMLEPQVDEKYYLTQEKIESISKWNAQQDPFTNMEKWDKDQVIGTLLTRDKDEHSGMKLVKEDMTHLLDKTIYMKDGELSKFNAENVLVGQNSVMTTLRTHGTDAKILVDNVFENKHHSEELAPTFKENHSNGIFIKENTKQGYAIANDGDGVYIQHMDKKRGTVQKEKIQTIKTQPDVGVVTKGLRIRKITPREALRLMGLDDKRIDLIQESGLVSHNKQYFIAGNSIVVNVLEAIFSQIDFPKDKPLKVFETFAGYGSQTIALENLGYDTHTHTSEWFVDAIISYALIHHNEEFMSFYKNGEWLDKENNRVIKLMKSDKEELIKTLSKQTFSIDSKKPSNLKTLDEDRLWALAIANAINSNKGSILDIKGKDLDQYDLLTYSFPCQDLSLAGKGKGMEKGSGTRSGLLWEVERILKELKELGKLPKVLLMENVPQVHSKQNISDFNKWQEALMDLGYKNTWKDLNAKDFGVPQNRERTFMVSILEGNVEDDSTVQLSLF